MPTLTIGDKKVTVGDDFMALPDAQKSATVDEIAKSMGLGQASPQAGSDSSTSPQNRGVIDKLVGLTGPRYQTWPERAVRSVGGDVKNLMDQAATAPISPEGGASLAPAAFEVAKDVTPLSRAPLLTRAAKATTAVAPTQEELLSVYKPLEQQGTLDVQLEPHVIGELKQNIHDALKDAHYRDYLAPQTYRAIEELDAANPKPTVMDVEGVRRLLGNVDPKEAKAVSVARDKINDYLSELNPEDVVGGANVGEILAKVRGNYAAGKRSQMVTMANEKGEFAAEASGSGANLDNTLRQQIKGILNNPKKLRGFSDEEKEQMRKIVKGGRIGNVARLLSKLGPKHPITGWSGAIAADLGGGAGAGMATLGTGHLAQMASEKLTQGHIKALDEAIRKRSPIFQERAAQQPGSPSEYLQATNPLYRGGVAGILSQIQGQQDQQ